MWARALILEADGEIAAALGALAECWDGCVSRGLTLEYPVLGADLVRLALSCGQRQRAQDVAAAVAEVADGNQVPSLTGAALRCRGLADDDAGGPARRRRRLRRQPAAAGAGARR